MKGSTISTTSTTLTYAHITRYISTACRKVRSEYAGKQICQRYQREESVIDGRLDSAHGEKWFLNRLVHHLRVIHPKLPIERSTTREWYDIRVCGIPINLKLTCGGTDNAFNKMSIEYTIRGEVPVKKKITFNEWLDRLVEALPSMSERRDRRREYHYLVFNKKDGRFRFTSLLDIRAFRSNPTNILQICWRREFQPDPSVTRLRYEKGKTVCGILEVIRQSLLQDYERKKRFLEMDFSWGPR